MDALQATAVSLEERRDEAVGCDCSGEAKWQQRITFCAESKVFSEALLLEKLQSEGRLVFFIFDLEEAAPCLTACLDLQGLPGRVSVVSRLVDAISPCLLCA